MKRRDFLHQSAIASLLGFIASKEGLTSFIGQAQAQDVSKDAAIPFSRKWLEDHARALAAKPHEAPKTMLPDNYQELNYDKFRDIRFKPENSIWRDKKLPFELQFFHTGFLFTYPIHIYMVENGQAQRLAFSKDLFSYGPLVGEPNPPEKAGFSGFRIHTPINTKAYFDEFAVFQGASYFRAIGAGHVYGLSARGLAIDTGQPQGEEFPVFRAFWIEQPKEGAVEMVVHALLDSPSVAGAYSFVLTPGQDTKIRVTTSLYPRRALKNVGIAPLTSMFLFAPNKKVPFDDFRPSVHDSDALLMLNGQGEWLWRPLINPRNLQFSAFVDKNPKGFGLIQRSRDFGEFEDLEARYEKRPSLWIEPVGDWGEGQVQLIEIPTIKEIHDNIVAFWQPQNELSAGQEYKFEYIMNWCWSPSAPPLQKAQVLQTRHGRAGSGISDNMNRLFIVDFKFPNVTSNVYESELAAEITASVGKISNIVLHPGHEPGVQRLSFQYNPDGAPHSDLRAVLTWKNQAVSEIWLYRWEI